MEPTNKTCPACNSDRLWHMSTTIEGKKCIIQISCLDCDKTFREIYDLKYSHTERIK